MENELFDESHFFTCTGGLKPARFKAGQNSDAREDGNFYLTEKSLTCKGIDFSCRYAALIAAIVAAALVLLLSNPGGWVVLAALGAAVGGAIVGAGLGFAICGCMAASFRTWEPHTLKNEYKKEYRIEGHFGVVNRPDIHLTCSAWFGQKIFFVQNVKNEFTALCIFAGNIFATGLQGFMYAYAFRGGGLLFKGKFAQFFGNMAVNWIKSWSVSGVAVRSVFAIWGGASSYYLSPIEGGDPESIKKGMLDGGLFFERALIRIATLDYKDPNTGKFSWEGLINDVALVVSLGGIPAGGNGKDVSSRGEVTNAVKTTISEWGKPVETAKSDMAKVVETARQIREKIRNSRNGVGATEKFKSIADPAKDVLGEGKISHPEEWNTIMKHLKELGVDIRFSDEEGLAYSPGLRKGEPGKMILNEDCSISALRHEYNHVLDDMNAGWQGFEVVYDIDYGIKTESNSYKIEIEEMRRVGNEEAVEQLKENYRDEIKTIENRAPIDATKSQESLDRINEIENL